MVIIGVKKMLLLVYSFVYLLSLILVSKAEVSNSILNDVISDDLPPPRHHKVHNLILNPDQHAWCELKQIRQIVTHAQCESQEMENFVCVGTCFSYSVPQTEPEIPGDEMLDYCDSCQPAESHWTTVVLNCEDDGSEYKVTKNIQRITNCSCAACRPMRKVPLTNDVLRHNDHRISELFYKMLPDNHPLSDLSEDNNNNGPMILGDHGYSQVSLGDLKKEFDLDSNQEKLLSGKLLMKDVASFTDNEDEADPIRSFLSH